jgi:hypothetical protein
MATITSARSPDTTPTLVRKPRGVPPPPAGGVTGTYDFLHVTRLCGHTPRVSELATLLQALVAHLNFVGPHGGPVPEECEVRDPYRKLLDRER